MTKESDISVGPVRVKESEAIIASFKTPDGGSRLMEYDSKRGWVPVAPNSFDSADLMEGTIISLEEIEGL